MQMLVENLFNDPPASCPACGNKLLQMLGESFTSYVCPTCLKRMGITSMVIAPGVRTITEMREIEKKLP